MAKSHPKAVESFLEEVIVRRELSDNFCFFNEKRAAQRPPPRGGLPACRPSRAGWRLV